MAKFTLYIRLSLFRFSLHNNDTVAKYPQLYRNYELSFSLHNNDTVAKFIINIYWFD
ncbi:MAG: hypothetical protein ACRCVI_01055 [Mycoplasmoidaceae bacterium]